MTSNFDSPAWDEEDQRDLSHEKIIKVWEDGSMDYASILDNSQYEIILELIVAYAFKHPDVSPPAVNLIKKVALELLDQNKAYGVPKNVYSWWWNRGLSDPTKVPLVEGGERARSAAVVNEPHPAQTPAIKDDGQEHAKAVSDGIHHAKALARETRKQTYNNIEIEGSPTLGFGSRADDRSHGPLQGVLHQEPMHRVLGEESIDPNEIVTDSISVISDSNRGDPPAQRKTLAEHLKNKDDSGESVRLILSGKFRTHVDPVSGVAGSMFNKKGTIEQRREFMARKASEQQALRDAINVAAVAPFSNREGELPVPAPGVGPDHTRNASLAERKRSTEIPHNPILDIGIGTNTPKSRNTSKATPHAKPTNKNKRDRPSPGSETSKQPKARKTEVTTGYKGRADPTVARPLVMSSGRAAATGQSMFGVPTAPKSTSTEGEAPTLGVPGGPSESKSRLRLPKLTKVAQGTEGIRLPTDVMAKAMKHAMHHTAHRSPTTGLASVESFAVSDFSVKGSAFCATRWEQTAASTGPAHAQAATCKDRFEAYNDEIMSRVHGPDANRVSSISFQAALRIKKPNTQAALGLDMTPLPMPVLDQPPMSSQPNDHSLPRPQVHAQNNPLRRPQAAAATDDPFSSSPAKPDEKSAYSIPPPPHPHRAPPPTPRKTAADEAVKVIAGLANLAAAQNTPSLPGSHAAVRSDLSMSLPKKPIPAFRNPFENIKSPTPGAKKAPQKPTAEPRRDRTGAADKKENRKPITSTSLRKIPSPTQYRSAYKTPGAHEPFPSLAKPPPTAPRGQVQASAKASTQRPDIGPGIPTGPRRPSGGVRHRRQDGHYGDTYHPAYDGYGGVLQGPRSGERNNGRGGERMVGTAGFDHEHRGSRNGGQEGGRVTGRPDAGVCDRGSRSSERGRNGHTRTASEDDEEWMIREAQRSRRARY